MRFLTIAVIVITVLSGCKDKTVPALMMPGISLELAKVRSEIISKINYQLFFKIPLAQEDSIPARLKLSFFLKKSNQADIILDFNALKGKVLSVKDNAGISIPFQHLNEHLIFSKSLFEEEAQNTIHIQFIAGETGLNRSKDFIYTLLVPDRASTVFPCFDQPDLKARYNLTLEVPKGWEAISTAPIVSDSIFEARRLVKFAESDLMSSYLFSFVVGKFKKIVDNSGPLTLTMYHRETDSVKVKRNSAEIFKLHRHSISWLEDYTGIPMPFQKFDFVLIPSFQYGGMEHVGAIQYRASSLMLEASPTPSQLIGRASLIAHETAHMWFGDLVTMRWFDDVWMKEVFANFMAAKIANPLFPDIDHNHRFLLSHYPAAYSVDRTDGTHPIRQPLENLKQAGSLYGPIIYQKAPIVMRMLEQEMGETNFRAGVREYLNTYYNRSADWNDLIEILDLKTEINLKRWSKIWVEGAGRPVFTIKYLQDDENDILQLTQVDPGKQGRTWPQKFAVDFNYQGDHISKEIFFRDRSNLTVSMSRNFYELYAVNFDATGQAYGVFDFGDKIDLGIYPFGYSLLNANQFERPLTRAALYIQLQEYFLYKKAYSPAYPLFIERFLFRENEKLNIELLLGHMETLYWRWMTNEERLEIAPKFEYLLLHQMTSTEDPSIKYTYYQSLVSIATTGEMVDNLFKIWSTQKNEWGLMLTERDYVKLSEQLALKLPSKSTEIADIQFSRLKNPDQIDRYKFIMPVLSGSTSSHDLFFASLADARNRQRETWVLDALRLLHHPSRASNSIKYLPKSLEMLEEIQLTGDIFFPKRWLDECFWGHQTNQAVKVVESFLKTNPDYNPRLRQKILQATDMLYRSAAMQEAKDKRKLALN